MIPTDLNTHVLRGINWQGESCYKHISFISLNHFHTKYEKKVWINIQEMECYLHRGRSPDSWWHSHQYRQPLEKSLNGQSKSWSQDPAVTYIFADDVFYHFALTMPLAKRRSAVQWNQLSHWKQPPRSCMVSGWHSSEPQSAQPDRASHHLPGLRHEKWSSLTSSNTSQSTLS